VYAVSNDQSTGPSSSLISCNFLTNNWKFAKKSNNIEPTRIFIMKKVISKEISFLLNIFITIKTNLRYLDGNVQFSLHSCYSHFETGCHYCFSFPPFFVLWCQHFARPFTVALILCSPFSI